jgi:aryl-alcohol dehydrogenase-like predicted oxidoreductase
MRYNQLGASELRVSEVCLGTMLAAIDAVHTRFPSPAP